LNACDVGVFLLDTVPFRIVQNHKEGDEYNLKIFKKKKHPNVAPSKKVPNFSSTGIFAVYVEYGWLASNFFYSLFLQQWDCLQKTENGGPLISSTKSAN
jgi:hypothetical protein